MQPVAEADRTSDVGADATDEFASSDSAVWRYRRKQIRELRAIRESAEKIVWWIRAAIVLAVGLFVVQLFV
jgi:hypothetical protein